MNTRISQSAALLFISTLLLTAFPRSVAAQGYNITDLGALLGTNSYAYGINNQGQVVGYWMTAGGSRAFLYSNGSMTDLGGLGGTNRYALSINASGQVVGFSDATNGVRAFLYSSGSMTNLGSLGGINSYAYGINDLGQIVGYVETTNGANAFLYRTNGVTNLGTLGGSNSFAFGINNATLAVGSSSTSDEQVHAFLWQNGVLTNLNSLISTNSGWSLNDARGINNSGSIVGWGITNGQEEAFLYRTGLVTKIGVLTGGTNSFAFGINNSNQVVGASSLTNGITQALLWQNGATTNLNSLLPFGSGWDLREARGINDIGEIVGWGVINGEEHAFLLAPNISPTITVEPQSRTVVTGISNVTFSVTASGTVPLTYQWRLNGANLASATQSSYSISNVQTIHAGNYSVIVSNIAGSSTSSNAILTVTVDPRNMGKGDWIYFLSDATNRLGGNVSGVTNIASLANYERLQGMQFIIVKCGDGGTIWSQFSSDLVSQAHASGLKILGYARVYGTNIAGEIAVATNALALGADGFVIDAEIEYESQNLSTNTAAADQYCQGIRAAYPHAFLAHSPFVYISLHSSFPYTTFGKYCDAVMPQCYWKSFGISPSNMVSVLNSEWNSWQNSLSGSNTNAIKPIVPVAQGWSPSFTNATTGTEIADFVNRLKTNSSPASVGGYKGVTFWRADLHTPDMWGDIANATIGNPTGSPLIVTQPQSQTATNGQTISFAVTATGAAPLNYQWRLNGSVISGATTNSYTLTNVQSSAVGVYSVIISNAPGVVLSSDALLSVASSSLWLETFELGLSNWTVVSGASSLTNSTTNHTTSGTNSAKAASSLNKMYRNLNLELDGNSRVTWWIYDSTQTRAFGEIRAYSGNGYGSGSLQQIFAIGRYHVGFGTGTGSLASETVDTSKYQGRVYAGSNAGWFNLDASGVPGRSAGWHKFEVERLSNGTTINFYVDGVLGRTITSVAAATWDSILIGSIGSGSTTGNAWFDDINVEYFGIPIITTQPASKTVNAGTNVSFSVTATGNSLSYQWRFKGNNISGATATTLTLNNVQTVNAGEYTVVVQNGVGATVSSVASLTVLYPPTIVTDPVNKTANVGTNVTFTVVASGPGTLSYQWQKNGVSLTNSGNVSGATNEQLTLSNLSQNEEGFYRVVVSNPAGSVTSQSAMLSINSSVAFFDDFESGLGNWTTLPGATALTLSTTKANPVSGSKTAYETNSLNKMYHNLGVEVQGRARATFWIYDDNGTQTRSFGEVRGYSGNGLTNGSLQQILAVGNYKTPFDTNKGNLFGETVNPNKYQGRLFAGANAGWFNLDAVGSPYRSVGWHKFEIERSTNGSVAHYFIDGVLSRTINDASAATWDTVEIGSFGSGEGVEGNAWFDDVKIENLTALITGQPLSSSNLVGSSTTFTVTAVGSGLKYQWRKNGISIANATNSSLAFSNVQVTNQADYSVVVSTATDKEYSAIASLIVTVTPTITSQPVGKAECPGLPLSFTVTASGGGLSFQWKKNGTNLFDGGNITGATSSNLTLSATTQNDAGSYSVYVSNLAGSITSSNATLTVNSQVLVDLDIDSDNDNGFGNPGRTLDEDEVENEISSPGKYIAIDSKDTDGDGVPDFADGFNMFGNEGTNAGVAFVPLILHLSPADVASTTIKFTYSASDPAMLARTTNVGGSYTYTPSGGRMRLWTKDASASRDKAPINAAGDFIASGDIYSLTNFNFSSSNSVIKLYIEGISPSGANADQISVEVNRQGDVSGCISFDAVRATIDFDSDGDGLVDAQETQLGTNPNNIDSDWDGRTDAEELVDGTDPNSNASVLRERLSFWKFNKLIDTNIVETSETVEGQMPIYEAGIVYNYALSWENDAMSLQMPRATNPPALAAAYDLYRTPTRPILTPKRGSVSFWFQPNWESEADIVPGSSQTRYTLFSLCQKGNTEETELTGGAYWGIEVNNTGTNLSFYTKRGESGSNKLELLSGRIDWQRESGETNGSNFIKLGETNSWHHIALSYSETNIALYLDGLLLTDTNCNDLTDWPGTLPSTNAFRIWIGGRLDETLANGSYESVETYNYAMDAEEIAQKYHAVADLDSDHDGLTDLEELRLGLKLDNADTDMDGMPDGWEVKFGLNPKDDSDADDNPDNDGRDNKNEFLFGTNPLVADDHDLISEPLPYDLVGTPDDTNLLFNIDFGDPNKLAFSGPAAAGIGPSDQWKTLPLFGWVFSIIDAGGSTNSGVYCASRYDPLTPVLSGSCWSQSSYGEGSPITICLCHGIVCEDMAYGGSSSDWQPFGCKEVCVRKITYIPIIHPDVYMSEFTINAHAFDLKGSISEVDKTVSTNKMFSDFAYCSWDSKRSWLDATECSSSFTDTSIAKAKMVIGSLPGRVYRLYFYSAPEFSGDGTPLELYRPATIIVNGLPLYKTNQSSFNPSGATSQNGMPQVSYQLKGGYEVTLAQGGANLPKFVNGVNYTTVTVQPTNGQIFLTWKYKNAALSGLQLVELRPLGKPVVEANVLITAGAMLQWATVPQALEYEIYRKSTNDSQFIKVSTTKSLYYHDSRVGAGDYVYVVHAKNEIYTSSSDPKSVTITAPGVGSGNHAPVLNYVRPLRQAVRGWPFIIGTSKIQAAADAFDYEGTPLRFMITEILSGTLEWIEEGENSVELTNEMLQESPRILEPNITLRWTPPDKALGDVPAFKVRAYDGVSMSLTTAEVPINVKLPTQLLWWGDYRQGMSGGGIPIDLHPEDHDGWRDECEGLSFDFLDDYYKPDMYSYTKIPSSVLVDAPLVQRRKDGEMLPIVDGTLRNVVQVASGAPEHYFHSRLALTSDGSVWVWGGASYGQLGDGNSHPGSISGPPWLSLQQPYVTRVDTISNVVSIATSGLTSMAVKTDGTVWGWGPISPNSFPYDYPPELIIRDGSELPDVKGALYSPIPYENVIPMGVTFGTNRPAQIPGLTNIAQVIASYGHFMALSSDGRIYWWGPQMLWETRFTSIEGDYSPKIISAPEKVIQIGATWVNWVALTESGKVYVGGRPSAFGGINTNQDPLEPFLIPRFQNGGAKQISTSEYKCTVLLDDGGVIEYDCRPRPLNSWRDPGVMFQNDSRIPSLENIVSVNTGEYGSFAVDAEGRVWGWGCSVWGLLGIDYHASGTLSRDRVGGYPSVTFPEYVSVPIRLGQVKDAEQAYNAYQNAYAIAIVREAPQNLEATPGDQKVMLHWDSFPSARQYYVKRTTSENGDYSWIATVAAKPGVEHQSYVDNSVINFQKYFYKVSVAVNGIEKDSDPASAIPQPLPVTPTGFVATQKSRQVQLTWPAQEDADAYKIYRSETSETTGFQQIATIQNQVRVAGRQILQNDGFLTPDQTYWYKLQAINVSGESGFSTVVSNTPTDGGPDAPLVAAEAFDTSVVLNLTPPSGTSGQALYVIRKAYAKCDANTNLTQTTSTLNWEIVDVTPKTTYEINRLSRGRCYAFSVSTIDDSGEGPLSSAETERPGASFVPPLTVIAKAGGPGTLYLKWQCEAFNFKVQVFKGIDGVYICGSTNGVIVDPDDDGLAELWLTGLASGDDYAATITPFTDDSFPASSTNFVTDEVRDGSSIPSVDSDYYPLKYPLKAVAANNRIELSWAGETDEIKAEAIRIFDGWRFILMRSETGQTTSVFPCDDFVPVADGKGLRFSDTNVLNEIPYKYRLVGINSSLEVYQRDLGDLTTSTNDDVISPIASFPANALLNLSAAPLNGTVQLSWSASNWTVPTDGSVIVELLYALGENEFFQTTANVTSTSTYFHQALNNGDTYHYKVRATHQNGDYIESAVTTATPGTDKPLPPPQIFSGSLGNNQVIVRWQPISGAVGYNVEKYDGSVTNDYTNFVNIGKSEFSDSLQSNYRYRISAVSAASGQKVEIRVQPLVWDWPPTAPEDPNSSFSATEFGVERKCLIGDTWQEIARTTYNRYVDVRLICLDDAAYYRIVPINATGSGQPIDPTRVVSNEPEYNLQLPPNPAAGVRSDVKIQLLDWDPNVPSTFTTPTNIILRASVAFPPPVAPATEPTLQAVEFYADGTLLGTDSVLPYEFTWINPPGTLAGKTYKIVARVVDSLGAVANSPTYLATVTNQPPLKSFTTAVTDIQLSASGIPLSFGRIYDSSDTQTGILGKGWKTTWEQARIVIPNLTQGWELNREIMSAQPFNIQESTPHRVEVRLPGGGTEYFHFTPAVAPGTENNVYGTTSLSVYGWLLDDFADDFDVSMPFEFQPEGGAFGELSENGVSTVMKVDASAFKFDENDNITVSLQRAATEQFPWTSFIYTASDGTIYEFGNPIVANGVTELCLISVKDRNGNTLTYNSSVTSDERVFTGITHSNGRSLQWDTASGMFRLFDPISPGPGGTPVLLYKVENDHLTEVHRLKNRTGTPEYDIIRYEYFSASGSDKVDGLLKRVISSEGVILLENDYFGTVVGDRAEYEGFLKSQTDSVGIKTDLDHDPDELDGSIDSTIIQTIPGADPENKGKANYNSAGELVGVTDESGNPSGLGYDGKGRLAYTQNQDGEFKFFDYDEKDRPTITTDELGNQTKVEYGPFDQPSETTDALKNSTRYEYYQYGSGSSHGPNDDNPEGALKSVTDPAGVITEYTYNNRGQVLTETRKAAGLAPITTSYSYYGASETDGKLGDLKVVREPLWPGAAATPDWKTNLYTTQYTCDANGNRATETKYRTVISRDSGGTVTETDTLQTVTTTYTYDAQNRLIESQTIVTGSGTPIQTSSSEYNIVGKTVASVDDLGRRTEMLYDVRGNSIETEYVDSTVTRTVYDARGRPVWQQERATLSGDQTTAPATFTEYDLAGRVVMTRRFATVVLEKKAAVPKTETEVITNAVTDYRRISGCDSNQFSMVFVSSNAPFISISRTVYDKVGRVQYSMDTRGNVTEYGYDEAGRRTSVKAYTNYKVDPLDSGSLIPDTTEATETTYGYDENGNQIWVIDGLEHQTDFYYDSMNRRIITQFPQVSGENGRKIQSTIYDPIGRRIKETDEAGVVTAFGYDASGRLSSVTNDWKSAYVEPDVAMVTSYGYDAFGNSISQTDAKGNTTLFEYDALGRRTHRILPGGVLDETVSSAPNPAMEKVTYSKEEIGSSGVFTMKKEVRDFRGKTITYENDLSDRLKKKTLPAINSGETATVIDYVYTAIGQPERVEMTNATVARTNYFAYDGLRRLLRKDTPEGVLAYTYRTDGNLATIKGYRRGSVTVNTDPDAMTPTAATADVSLTYGYDSLGRLKTVTNNLISAPNVTTYYYDAIGNLDYYVYPNGVKHDYSYTEQNRLKHLAVTRSDTTLLRSYAYSLSPTGQRIGVAETNYDGTANVQRRRVVYEYDKDYGTPAAVLPRVNRLTRETLFDAGNVLAGTISHVYDLVGNRTARTVTDAFTFTPAEAVANQTLNFDQRDLIDGNTTADDANDYFDAAGNTLKNEAGTPTGDLYDAENHLIKRGTDIEIQYDSDGNRAWKDASAITTYYLLDDRNPSGYVQVLAEYINTSSTPTRTYAYGHDLISQTLDTTTSYYGYDGHGSVRFLTDSATGSSTAETDSYDYDVYGKLLASTGTTLNNYRYAGEQWDADLGMYYLRARYLNPETGRFWTMDSFEGRNGDPLSLHKYLYCQANPINRIDPSGNTSFGDISTAMFIYVSNMAFRYPTAALAVRGAIALTTVGLFVWDQQFRDAMMAMGPAGAAEALAAEGAELFAIGYRGTKVAYRFVSGFVSSEVEILPRVEQIMTPVVGRIKALYPDADIGFRGSLSRGASFDKGTGGLKPFDAEAFDVDAFVVSDTLAAKIGGRGFRQAAEFKPFEDEIQAALAKEFPGIKAKAEQTGYGFTFRVYSREEFQKLRNSSFNTF